MTQDDFYDYYFYMHRRFTLKSFEDLCTFADRTLKQNRTVIKNAISYIRLQNKVKRERAQLTEAFTPELEAYLESDDYKKLQETLKKAEDEDEYKNDTDPQGYLAFDKLVSLAVLS